MERIYPGPPPATEEVVALRRRVFRYLHGHGPEMWRELGGTSYSHTPESYSVDKLRGLLRLNWSKVARATGREIDKPGSLRLIAEADEGSLLQLLWSMLGLGLSAHFVTKDRNSREKGYQKDYHAFTASNPFVMGGSDRRDIVHPFWFSDKDAMRMIMEEPPAPTKREPALAVVNELDATRAIRESSKALVRREEDAYAWKPSVFLVRGEDKEWRGIGVGLADYLESYNLPGVPVITVGSTTEFMVEDSATGKVLVDRLVLPTVGFPLWADVRASLDAWLRMLRPGERLSDGDDSVTVGGVPAVRLVGASGRLFVRPDATLRFSSVATDADDQGPGAVVLRAVGMHEKKTWPCYAGATDPPLWGLSLCIEGLLSARQDGLSLGLSRLGFILERAEGVLDGPFWGMGELRGMDPAKRESVRAVVYEPRLLVRVSLRFQGMFSGPLWVENMWLHGDFVGSGLAALKTAVLGLLVNSASTPNARMGRAAGEFGERLVFFVAPEREGGHERLLSTDRDVREHVTSRVRPPGLIVGVLGHSPPGTEGQDDLSALMTRAMAMQ